MTAFRYTPNTYQPLLHWLIMVGLFGFGLFLSWDLGLLPNILAQDATYISSFVLAVLLVGSLHAGIRSLYLSKQVLGLIDYCHLPHLHSTLSANNQCLSLPYLQHLMGSPNHSKTHLTETNTPSTSHADQTSVLAELMAERARGSHQVGWFLVGLCVKLGLLGTVAGFIMMLGSLDSLDSLDASKVTDLMAQMTQGMKVAMNTTLVGLSASMLLGAQYLLVDRVADTLVADTLAIGQALTEQNANSESGHGTV
ncbi:MAG: MotA/TolQ/ExbB proton channel family protein [Pontibacterium sp.]